MALPQINQPFVPDKQEQIRDAMLTDYRLEMIKTTSYDPAVTPGSEPFVWATMFSGVGMLMFSNIELSRDAITPLNATGQDLENWRLALGLPEVKPSPSTGRIVVEVPGGGSGTLSNGQPVQLPNGLRAEVVGNWIGITDGSEVDVQAIDKGSATNFDSGTPVSLVSPPGVFSTSAKVSGVVPLTGGTDDEDDARKRSRILNTLANKPAGGNWAELRELALEALLAVQDCYVYPALGGPASVKVAPVRDFDTDNRLFTRSLSTAALNIVRTNIYNHMPDGVEVVVETPEDEPADATIFVTLPASSLSGGNGNGWLDQFITPDTGPWPQLVTGSSEQRVTVTTVNATTQIVVSALTNTSPIVGQTHVMWWSPVDMTFRSYLVVGASGSSGAWSLTLDRPLLADDGTPVAVGDYLSPACANADAYAESWINTMRALGTGENTTDPNRLPRALRHPYIADEDPSSLTFLTLRAFQDGHPEISDLAWGYLPTRTPAVPATVADKPHVLVPRHFGIYSQ